MSRRCVVDECSSKEQRRKSRVKDLRPRSFFRVPNCPKKRQLWKDSLGQELNDYEFVCDLHFINEHIVKGNSFMINGKPFFVHHDRWHLIEDAVPVRHVDQLNDDDSLRSSQSTDAVQSATKPVDETEGHKASARKLVIVDSKLLQPKVEMLNRPIEPVVSLVRLDETQLMSSRKVVGSSSSNGHHAQMILDKKRPIDKTQLITSSDIIGSSSSNGRRAHMRLDQKQPVDKPSAKVESVFCPEDESDSRPVEIQKVLIVDPLLVQPKIEQPDDFEATKVTTALSDKVVPSDNRKVSAPIQQGEPKKIQLNRDVVNRIIEQVQKMTSTKLPASKQISGPRRIRISKNIVQRISKQLLRESSAKSKELSTGKSLQPKKMQLVTKILSHKRDQTSGESLEGGSKGKSSIKMKEVTKWKPSNKECPIVEQEKDISSNRNIVKSKCLVPQPSKDQLIQNVYNKISNKDGGFDVCLVCLNPNVEFDNVKITINIITDMYDVKVSLENIIKSLFNINNVEDECISTLVCTECCHRLTECYKFVQHFKSCQSIVRNCLDQIINKVTNIETQEEAETQDSDFDSKPTMEIELTTKMEELNDKVDIKSMGNFKCRLCGELFLTRVAFKHHWDQHTDEDKYMCKQCGKRLHTTRSLTAHQRRMHANELKECHECKAMVRPHLFKQHMAVHLKLHACELCGDSFKTRTRLMSHKHYRHKIKMFEKMQCPKCGLLVDKPRYWKHVSSHRRVECKICNKMISSGNIKKHIMNHDGTAQTNKRMYQCKDCDRTFSSRSAMEPHYNRVHRNIKPYKCQHCDKDFHSKGNWSTHIKMHTQRKHIQCELCGAKLLTQIGYRNHMMNHNDIKFYKCTICPARYVTYTSLDKHVMRKHRDQHAEWHMTKEKVSLKDPEIMNRLKEANLLHLTTYKLTGSSDTVN